MATLTPHCLFLLVTLWDKLHLEHDLVFSSVCPWTNRNFVPICLSKNSEFFPRCPLDKTGHIGTFVQFCLGVLSLFVCPKIRIISEKMDRTKCSCPFLSKTDIRTYRDICPILSSDISLFTLYKQSPL